MIHQAVEVILRIIDKKKKAANLQQLEKEFCSYVYDALL